MAALRKWLLTGLLVIVPGVITAWVLNWIVSTLDQTLQILPGAWQPDKLLGVHVPGFGVVLTLAILLVVGAIASNFAGRKLVEWGDALVHRIPVVRSIYSSVKQVSDTLFSESGNAFRTAVLVQWPRDGVWTVAFITGQRMARAARLLRDTTMPGKQVAWACGFANHSYFSAEFRRHHGCTPRAWRAGASADAIGARTK